LYRPSEGNKNLLIAANGEFNNYNAIRFKQTAETLKAQQQINRMTESEVVEHLAIKSSSQKEKLIIPQALYPEFSNLLARVNAALNRTVFANTIAKLEENPDLAKWVKTGLHRHQNQSEYCQFCDQVMPFNRIEELENHFNDAFE